jgi:hypothetical protein
MEDFARGRGQAGVEDVEVATVTDEGPPITAVKGKVRTRDLDWQIEKVRMDIEAIKMQVERILLSHSIGT